MENKRLLIAFGCQSRVGKDSCCEYLQKKYGGFIISHAQPIYTYMHDTQHKFGFEHKKDPQFLQFMGQWVCKHDPNFWVEQLNKKIDDIPQDENIYVSDVRKNVELKNLQQRGFVLVRIDRPDRPIDRDPNHVTETELLGSDQWDDVILNNSSLEDMYAQIDSCIRARVYGLYD